MRAFDTVASELLNARRGHLDRKPACYAGNDDAAKRIVRRSATGTRCALLITWRGACKGGNENRRANRRSSNLQKYSLSTANLLRIKHVKTPAAMLSRRIDLRFRQGDTSIRPQVP